MTMRTAVAMLATGLILSGSSSVLLGLADAWSQVRLPVGSPWAATLFVAGLTTIAVPGFLLADARGRRARKLPAHRALVADSVPAAAVVGRDHNSARATSVRGPAAAPCGANGGGAAATIEFPRLEVIEGQVVEDLVITERLPAVRDEGRVTARPAARFGSGVAERAAHYSRPHFTGGEFGRVTVAAVDREAAAAITLTLYPTWTARSADASGTTGLDENTYR
jgi:hypothetical protein